ncbi:TonB-dependent receptor [Pseudomonas fulva]|uniref:TonB-dependent siderophore receptor n=1 Tax=Pseudomonas fulva (strain 12-X) TaxID=743720 RepID=F6AIE5_PSEF1|nr:TonB-dependent receptor [Pseudomonas fulva]AEF20533.1 TonB-dependent siderophore receptor [Pseudomonas fulva 12-X]
MSIHRAPTKTVLTSLWLPVCFAASFSSAAVYAQTSLEISPQEAQSAEADGVSENALELEETAISASADASREGLVPEYEGGQVARGGRVGILGNKDYMETPFTSTSYTNQLIQDQQAHSVADILQNDPSVRIARGFGNFQELYVVRGFPLYSDDISYNGLYGLLPRQYVASEFIERVEVFRGANAFLNGAAPGGTGIGGAINILPKRAPNDPLTRLTVGAETNGFGTVSADVARRFGEEDRFGVRLNMAKRDGETSVKDQDRTLDMFSLGLDYQGDRLRLSADVGHQYHFIDRPQPSVTPTGGIPSAPDAKDNYGQSWTYSKEKQTFGTFRAEYDLSDAVTTWAAAGMRKGEEKNVLANPSSNAAGVTSAYRFDNYREETVTTGEVGMRFNLQTGPVSHEWVVSGAMYDTKDRNAYAASDYDNPFAGSIYNPYDTAKPENINFGGSMSDPNITARTHTQSLAIADTLGFFDNRLLVTLGARRQGLDVTGYDYDSGNRTSKYKKYETTPVAGIVYQLNEQVSVYGNYIEGLTAGEIAGRTTTLSDGSIVALRNPNASLAPYVSKQTELGLKYDGGFVGGSIALFQTEKPFSTVEDRTFKEGGEQRNRGIELSVFGEPTQGVRLLGGLTLLDAKLTKTQDGANDGNEPIGVPKIQANIGGEWDVPGFNGLSLNSRVTYTDSQYTNNANSLEIPSWTRLDIGARYGFKLDERDVTLRARLDNVTGRDYWASTGGYPGSNYLTLGEPRTLSVSATIDF